MMPSSSSPSTKPQNRTQKSCAIFLLLVPVVSTVTTAPQPPQKPVLYTSANPVYYITGCDENSLTISAQVSNPSTIKLVKIHWIYLGGLNNPGTEKIFDMNPAANSRYSMINMDPKLHTAYPNLNDGNGKIQYWIEVLYQSGAMISSNVNYVEVILCPG